MSFFLPSEALESDIAILGRKGRGKTFTAKGIVEKLLEQRHRTLVIDPLGVWWGLRVDSSGKGNGFDVAIFGGKHADIPLHEEMARPLAQLIAKENIAIILDVSEFRRNQQNSFVAALLDELMKLNREALTIVLEEADTFAPQNPMPDTTKVLYEVDRVARRGRAFGFRLITITQRPAKLHKDVLTQLSTLIALGVTSPQDRDALKAWVEGNGDREQAKMVYNTLANLKVGEGWVWSPDFNILERVQFPKIKTLDTSKTPKAGETRLEPKRLDDLDLSDIRAKLAELQEEKTPAKVVEASGVEISPKTLEARLEAVRKEAFELGYEKGHRVGFTEGHTKGQVSGKEVMVHEMRQFLDGYKTQNELTKTSPVPKQESTTHALPPSKIPVSKPGAEQPKNLSPSASKILGVLVGVYPMGLSYPAAAARAGVSKRSSQYRQYRKEIEPYTALRNGKLVANDSVLESVPPLPQTLEAWYSSLTPSVSAMLKTIAESNTPLDKYAIAVHAGVSETSSGLGAGLRELQDLGLIEKTGHGYALLEELKNV
jgi:uncharacterized protein